MESINKPFRQNKSAHGNTGVASTDFLQAMCTQLGQHGIEPEQWLKGSRVRRQMWESQSVCVSLEQFEYLCHQAWHLSQNPNFGIDIGNSLHTGGGGFFGFTVMACANVNQLLSWLIRYLNTQTSLVKLAFTPTDTTAVIELQKCQPLSTPTHTLLAHSLLSSLATVITSITPNDDARTDVVLHMAHHANMDILNTTPLDTRALAFTLRASPHDMRAPQLCFPRSYLDNTVTSAKPITRSKARKECELLLEHPHDVVHNVRRYLRQHGLNMTLPDVAQGMNISPRTLNRQLAQLNTHYQEVLDSMRCELAMSTLLKTDAPINEIASDLGFATASNFTRAFKHWLDMSPRQFRQNHRTTTSHLVS